MENCDLVTVAHREGFKTFDFDAEFVNDAPGDDLLTSDPGSGLFIVRLSKEELKVEQVTEAATLEKLHLDTR